MPTKVQNLYPKTLKIFDGFAVLEQKKTPLFLDTLAQLELSNGGAGFRGPFLIDPNDGVSKLRKRAKSKYFTGLIAIPLAELRNKLEKYYRNAHYCNNTLLQSGLRVTSKYCNTRICNTCNRIRTAKLINGYQSELAEHPNKRFVTLTVPNVLNDQLELAIADMQKCLFLIKATMKRQKIKYAGLRKLEITYNAIRNDFHPHFHLIIDSLENAEIFLNLWLKMNPYANRGAQNIREVDDDTMMELFKYSTKVITDVNGKGVVNIPAVDTIMRAIYGKRVIQPFGAIKKQVSEEVEELQAHEYVGIPEYEMMEWVWEKEDWVNEYGELLTGHTPSVEIQALKIVNNFL